MPHPVPDGRPTTTASGSRPLSAATVSTALSLLTASADTLVEAHWASTAGERYTRTRLAVLRAAAAVLAVRGGARRGGGPTPVWDLLPRVAPELTEWSEHFATTMPHDLGDLAEHAALRGASPVRLVDDLLRDGEEFARVVARVIGLPQVHVTSDRVSVSATPGA